MSNGQRNVTRIVLFVVCAVFILIGWYREELRIVFIKAANICLECIGIG